MRTLPPVMKLCLYQGVSLCPVPRSTLRAKFGRSSLLHRVHGAHSCDHTTEERVVEGDGGGVDRICVRIVRYHGGNSTSAKAEHLADEAMYLERDQVRTSPAVSSFLLQSL
jgi:hypothetical protein